MSTECDRIADQFYRGVEGDAWLGPPVRALLADVTAEMAAARPIPNAHTIWELVLHMTVWAEIARRGVAGEVVEPTASEDWPLPPPPSAAGWNEAVAALERSHGELRRAALALGESHLEDRTPGKPHKLYVQLHGVLQHTLYHAGQIAILKTGRREIDPGLPAAYQRPTSGLPMAEQRDQDDDDRKRHAEQEKQYRPRDDSVVGEPSLG